MFKKNKSQAKIEAEARQRWVDRMKTAWEEGFEAGQQGKPCNAPYIAASFRQSWYNGYDDGKRNRVG